MQVHHIREAAETVLKPAQEARRKRGQGLMPIECPSCHEVITWTACPGGEAWCRTCKRWAKATPPPGGTP